MHGPLVTIAEYVCSMLNQKKFATVHDVRIVYPYTYNAGFRNFSKFTVLRYLYIKWYRVRPYRFSQ